MAFQKKTVEVKEAETRHMILVDTGIEIPVTLNFEGQPYELKPDGVIPEGLARKLEGFSQYEEYDAKNKRHVELVENKDTMFVTRKKYGTFEMMREWELLSPSQRDEVIEFINKLKNPVIEEPVDAIVNTINS